MRLEHLPDLPMTMLAAILPPGAFFGLAALIALRNWLTTRDTNATVQKAEAEART